MANRRCVVEAGESRRNEDMKEGDRVRSFHPEVDGDEREGGGQWCLVVSGACQLWMETAITMSMGHGKE